MGGGGLTFADRFLPQTSRMDFALPLLVRQPRPRKVPAGEGRLASGDWAGLR